MDTKKISVLSKRLAYKPNLLSYEKEYKKFSYKNHLWELSFFKNKKLNAAYNAVDRHITTWRKNKIALFWEGEDGSTKRFTFYDLAFFSNKFANVLKKYGIEKGDRVFIFLPRVPELYISFLSILKIGAIAGTLFSAFQAQALKDRLIGSAAKILITNNELKKRVAKIKKDLPDLKKIITVEDDFWKEIDKTSPELSIAKTNPYDPAFMLYTSGTTGKPKGIVHQHYAVLHEHLTAKWVLDIKDEDVYWCVPPNTIVITNPEPKSISNLKIGEKVLTHTGEFYPVKRVYKRFYDGLLTEITSRYSNIPMLLTPNHRVLSGIRGRKRLDWIPSGNLTKNDYLVFPRIRKIRDRRSISISKTISGCEVKKGKVWRKKLIKKISDQIKVDHKFMLLAGYYLAEGSIAGHKSIIQFTFNKNETEYATEVVYLIKSVFNIETYKLNINNLIEIRCNSVILAELFEKLFGSISYQKKIPQWFIYLPNGKLSSLIKGFWRGDGDKDRDRFRFCTTSATLAYQLKIIFHKLGLVPTFRCVSVEKIKNSSILGRYIKAKHDCYYLTIGGKSLKRISEILGEDHPFIKERVSTYQYAYVTPNYVWMPIASIKKIPYKGEVLNLETKTGSYTLNNMSVHNCTADPGWVTGIAYEILGSWSNGSSTLVYEGRFDPAKWYDLLARYRVTVWYTAPTAIRLLAAAGAKLVTKYDLSFLRHMASVGEPLNPEPIYWGLKAFKKPFHDNYWQTETGGIVIANYPSMDIKPGSMGKPVPGITTAIVDNQGKELGVNKQGNLALKPGWPSMMIKIWRRPEKYQSYFKNGWYITGDLAFKDKDGYYWFVGRSDDVIKTSGERVGPFEVESALVSHPSVVEAGVIGKPDPVRGEIIKAFVVLKKEVKPTESLKKEISEFVKRNLAGHAYPREVEFIDKLPKTRSGKIMRRILKAKELGLPIGDTSTLEEY